MNEAMEAITNRVSRICQLLSKREPYGILRVRYFIVCLFECFVRSALKRLSRVYRRYIVRRRCCCCRVRFTLRLESDHLCLSVE